VTVLKDDPSYFVVEDLGRLPYEDAYGVQLRVHQQVLDGDKPQTVLLVEHDPVVTVSRRHSASGHLLADPQRLAELGIDVQPTDRGGDITYHGPGQLVAYPILRLGLLGLNVGRYMRLLEDVVIDTVGAFGVCAQREPKRTGVWVDEGASAKPAKLCAMGVRVRKGVTMHGLALNVTTNLSHFQTIVPCGLAGCSVTSLEQLLGSRVPEMEQVKAGLIDAMRRRLQAVANPTEPIGAL